jgi:predicted Ser/Thr protein kinase
MRNAVCPTDEELIPMLVGESADPSIASHLHECSSCRRRLDMFQSDLNALRNATVGMPPVAPPSRPSRIGKYLIVGELDSGGQAIVYRAVHPTLDKELAIKLSFRAVGQLSNDRPLLIAEGKLLAKLDHPGLARVYDLDFHEDRPFLAMEFVHGPNLAKYAAQSSLTPAAAAGIVAQVGHALAVVHRHGIVHQDIKPQNILIDENGSPRLIDFGMARLRHAWDDSGERTSGGTPAFMSPEQARQDESLIGTRSDVFGLGCVLYYLLTGKPPFGGKDNAERFMKAGRCEFDRDALQKPGISRELREICLKAMAPAPAGRFQTVQEFTEALDGYLARPALRKRQAMLSAAAILVLGLGVVGWQNWPRPQPAPVAAAPGETPQELQLLVSRGGKPLEIAAAMPLREGDRFRTIGRIPVGHHALLLRLTPGGKVETLPYRTSPADHYVKVIYPPEEGTLDTFAAGEHGTELLLLCAAEDPRELDGLREKVQQELTSVRVGPDSEKARVSRLPTLPENTPPIWLDRNEPQRDKMSLNHGETDSYTLVVDRLDSLRIKLRDRPLSVLRGVAFSR